MHLNVFRKRIDFFAVLASNFFFITSCIAMPMRIEKQAWFLSAKDYVEGYELPHKFGQTDGEKDLLSMAQIERARKNYLISRQPTGEEILAVLNSSDDLKTKIALGAMVLRPLPEYEVIKKIISFWDHPSRLHRDFASRSLVKIDRSEIRDFQDLGDMIFEYAKKTSDLWVLSNAIMSLGKFNNPKYLPFIIKYLKKHDNPLLHHSSFWALKEMDDKYFQQVRRQLQREGDLKTLKIIEETEHEWRKVFGNDTPSNFFK